MSVTSNFTVAVLAGGESRRFGSPKSQARFFSKTLLEIMLQKAFLLSEKPMVVTGRNPVSIPENIPAYRDIYADCGPLGGIYTALYHSKQPHVAILPCDMPLLELSVYQLLLEHINPDRPIVAVSEKGLEPLVSVWPVASSFSKVEKNLRLSLYSIYKTLQELEAIHLNIPAAMADYQPQMFMNINYQEDLQQLEFMLEDNYVIKDI